MVNEANPEPDEKLADAAAEARGETPAADSDGKPCSPAEAAANAEQTAQRAS